jgi:homopolymeric O-antigen transport system ATP-binding protein
MESVLTFQHVSKKFIRQSRRSKSFVETVVHSLSGNRDPVTEDFWVVRDLCLRIKPGEAVGMIGDNGAGKSTILKLAARIVEPTSGLVTLNGRVGALLEVGVGFHPDLSGRENVYLSGSIIGIGREEMGKRLDEIIDFSGVEDFIDMPVRHYSSGMMVRLGFSVATAIDPDILLIDEVLSVGDVAFREKCLARIKHLQEKGTAILYVSHNVDEVREICDRAVWLLDAHVECEGTPDQVVREYLNHTLSSRSLEVWELGMSADRGRKLGSGGLQFGTCLLIDASGSPISGFVSGTTLILRVEYDCEKTLSQVVFGISLYTEDGARIIAADSQVYHDILAGSSGTAYLIIESLGLRAGQYELTVAAFDPRISDYTPYAHYQRAYVLDVVSGTSDQEALIRVPFRWALDDEWPDIQSVLESRDHGSA